MKQINTCSSLTQNNNPRLSRISKHSQNASGDSRLLRFARDVKNPDYHVVRRQQKSSRISIQYRRFVTSSDDAAEEIRGRQLLYDELYPGHISTSAFQKTLLAFGSGVTAILDPSRDDMVSAFGETTGYLALRRLQKKMLQDPVGRQILEERPILNSTTINIDYLGSLPEETFGKQYWNFLSKNGFSPDARHPVQFVDDGDLQYVMLRYRQIHDLLHTVLGMPPHMLGEVVVKTVETFQTGLPMCALAALFGPVRLGPIHRQKFFNTYLSWALRCGTSAKFLMAVYYEKHWEDDLTDFRQKLNIIDPPAGIGKKKTRNLKKDQRE